MRRLLVLLAAAGAGCAQTVTGPEPALVSANAPKLEYRSAFDGYRSFAEDKPVPWRDANEAVKESDHRGHE
jgi:hypothetical protein